VRRVFRPLGVTVALMLGIVIAGCGANASVQLGGSTVEHVDQSVSQALVKAVGEKSVSVSCPDEIPAEDGHHFRCVVTEKGGTRFGATVTESNVRGEGVNLDVQVDQHPLK
jgi:hypothetical protein